MTIMDGLSTLTRAASTSDRPMMRVMGEVITGRRFASAVAVNSQRLVAHDASVVAIHTLCAYQFSVALFAALHAQKDIIILPNLQPGFIEKITDAIDLLITDETNCASLAVLNIEEPANDKPELIFPAIANSASLSFFTSGSTGFPERIYKTLQQIADELEVLTSVWDMKEKGGAVYTTVSYQHFYGFTFALMWPLAVGRLIDAKQYYYPEPLVAELEKDDQAILISSPALLNRVEQLVDLSLLAKGIECVFSAGGPLNREAALAISTLTESPVREIFGSTETGVVAYRSQLEGESGHSPWSLFPMVTMQRNQENHCLRVDSPLSLIHI